MSGTGVLRLDGAIAGSDQLFCLDDLEEGEVPYSYTRHDCNSDMGKLYEMKALRSLTISNAKMS
jgi:hypothetical protein